jgi:hypothetical protein
MREEREELERDREKEELHRNLKFRNQGENDELTRRFEEWEKLSPKGRIEEGSRIANYWRNAFESAGRTLGVRGDVAVKQFNNRVFQFNINKQNAKAFEQLVNTKLRNSTSNEVANQVSLLVQGTLEGKAVSARIRIDNFILNNGEVHLVEAKYSVTEITLNNYTKKLTPQQSTAFELITTGTNVQIFVRGNNAIMLGFSPGQNITGEIKSINIVTNSQQGDVKTAHTIDFKTN